MVNLPPPPRGRLNERAEIVLVLAQQLAELAHELASRGGWHGAPCKEGGLGLVERDFDVGRRGFGDRADLAAVDRRMHRHIARKYCSKPA